MARGTLTDSLTETLELFDGSGEPRTTTELAEELDLGRRSTYDRLEGLVDRDRLRTKKVGANARVWWRPSAGSGTPDEPPGGGGGRDGREEFESLVDAVEEYAIFLLDAEGVVRTWNEGARRIKGYTEGEIVGEHFTRFYAADDRRNDVPRRNLATAARDGSVEDEGWRIRADGSRFWANVTITAIHDGDGDLEGFAKVTRDMTERREHERRLRRERDFNRRVLETAPAALFVLDPTGDVVVANERFRDRLGTESVEGELTVGDLTLYDESETFVPPEKRPYRRVFETGESVTDWRGKIELADGTERWVTVNAAPIDDDGEDVGRVVVAARDVTRLYHQERRLERQLTDLKAELDNVFTRIDDAFFALDDEWRFTHVNERAGAVLEQSPESLAGRRIWEAFPGAVGSVFEEKYRRAMDAQETVTFEEFFSPLEAWFEVTAYPSMEGLSVYFRDVTERKRRERELERYESIVETVWDGVYALDSDGNFAMINDAFLEMTGYDREELLGEPATVVHNEEIDESATREVERVVDGEQDVAVLQPELVAKDGETVPVETRFGPYRFDDVRYGRCGVVRDVSERQERERELEQYETIVSTMQDGVYVLDEQFCFVMVNDVYAEMTGYDREELLGEHCSLVIDDETAAASARQFEEMLAGESEGGTLEADIYRADGTTLRAESRFTAIDGGEDRPTRNVGVVRDVSDRVARERQLERRVRQQEVVTDLGRRALEDGDLDELMAEVAERVAETLDNDYCKVLDLDAEAEELTLRQGVGWNEGLVGSATVSAVESDSQAAYTLSSEEPVVVRDLTTESRFSGPDLLRDHDVRSGISTIIGSLDDPWGILGTHDRTSGAVSDQDVNFVQSVANILATAINRRRDEQRLLAQRERLAALNNLNGVVREITDAVIDRSTREEIERTVCERLAGAESYQFAWIGDVDTRSEEVVPRTEAGVEGFLDDITITVAPDDDHGQGPTGKALRTAEIAVVNDSTTDSRHDPWRDHFESYEFRSSAAIPIVHEDTVYGVLNVYAERPNAFVGEELAVVEVLGELVGHAIAAAERKQALMSDELVELDFHVPNVTDAFGVQTGADEQITLRETVPVGDGDFLVYGTAGPGAVDVVRDLVAALDHWTSVEFHGEGDPAAFELRLSDPPVLSVIASLGGYVEEAVMEDGDFDLRVHLAPSVDVRRVIDAVTDAYPDAEMRRRRQITRDPDEAAHLRHRFVAELTDRQRSTLEAAYHAGFFEWPRDASGEDVATSLDVAPPTFHQHLRKAERKLLDALFAPETDAESPRRD